jgi:hypothetical protein
MTRMSKSVSLVVIGSSMILAGCQSHYDDDQRGTRRDSGYRGGSFFHSGYYGGSSSGGSAGKSGTSSGSHSGGFGSSGHASGS